MNGPEILTSQCGIECKNARKEHNLLVYFLQFHYFNGEI